MTDGEVFEQWSIVEMLGHRRLAGLVREVEVAGAGFLRLDIPATPGHGPATQFLSPKAVYALHPTSEAIATAAAARFRPEPVSRWELEAAKTVDAPYDNSRGQDPDPWADDDDPDDDEADENMPGFIPVQQRDRDLIDPGQETLAAAGYPDHGNTGDPGRDHDEQETQLTSTGGWPTPAPEQQQMAQLANELLTPPAEPAGHRNRGEQPPWLHDGPF